MTSSLQVHSLLLPPLNDEGILESSLEEGQGQTRPRLCSRGPAAVSACILLASGIAIFSAKGAREVITHNQPVILAAASVRRDVRQMPEDPPADRGHGHGRVRHRGHGHGRVRHRGHGHGRVRHPRDRHAPRDAALAQARHGAAIAHCGEVQLPPPGGQCNVSILHLSDTHNIHWGIEQAFALPTADILLHTGDFSNFGTDGELANFDGWIGHIKDRFKHLYLISGNHDWIHSIDMVNRWQLAPEETVASDFMQRKFKNIEVIDFKTIEVLGLKIHGSAWSPWFTDAAPGDEWRMQWSPSKGRIFGAHKELWKHARNSSKDPPVHRYDEIPEDVDILMTHGPALDIFDMTLYGHWGGSKNLRSHIEQNRPKMHLFGHVHEQRGEWKRWDKDSNYAGGVEYEPADNGAVFQARDAPMNYAVDLVSNNAMINNPQVDASCGHWQAAQIKGPARLITAQWRGNRWHFTS